MVSNTAVLNYHIGQITSENVLNLNSYVPLTQLHHNVIFVPLNTVVLSMLISLTFNVSTGKVYNKQLQNNKLNTYNKSNDYFAQLFNTYL